MLGFWNDGDISLKLVDKFTYLGSSVSSTEKDITYDVYTVSEFYGLLIGLLFF